MKAISNLVAAPILFSIGLLCLESSSMAQGIGKGEVVSKGARFDIKKSLIEEGTTVLLFVQDTSSMEQQFLKDLEGQLPFDKKVALNVVRLKDVTAPAASQYSVIATPIAVIYDRFGRELGRTSIPEEIKAAVRKGQLMARIKWVDEDDPTAVKVYGATSASLKKGLPGIVKTMALRPDAFEM